MTRFRPDQFLFPLAAGWAALAVPVWLLARDGAGAGWHGHEMLFGFAFAVIGGFLYTRRHAFWPPALAVAWVGGRLAGLSAPSAAVTAAGMAYPLLLTFLLLPGLWRSAKRIENRIAPAVVGMLALLDLAWWGAVLSGRAHLAATVLSVTLDALALLMLVMGGRALRAALGGYLERRGEARRDRPDRENERRLAALLGAALALEWFDLKVSSSVLLVLAAGLALWRLKGWSPGRVREDVRLWTLAAGYLWIPVGLFVKALWLTGLLPGLTGIHALAVGALGTLTLVMMARTALLRAHRPLEHLADLGLGVVLIGIATLCRLGADLLPVQRTILLWSAALCWSAAFLLLLVRLVGLRQGGQ